MQIFKLIYFIIFLKIHRSFKTKKAFVAPDELLDKFDSKSDLYNILMYDSIMSY